MQEQNNKFEFSYSAPTALERREIESIRAQYEQKQPKAESKLERLRRLDASVRNTATCVALVLGVVGILVFGLGMAMVLEWNLHLWGVIVGVVGVLPMTAAYPAYKLILKKMKEKYGAEILRLAQELLPTEEK